MNVTPKILLGSLAALLCADLALAASKEARVTQIIREVKILPADAAAREAVVNDRIADDTGVRTGGDSRSELTFPDLTITRLGSNTIFSFNKAGRNVQVDSGSILLRVPKDSGGGKIKTNAVTVAVTGTTVIVESVRGGRNKLVVLEGSARLSLVKYPKQSQTAHGGQMIDVPPGATTVPPPVNIDLNDLMRKHPLITDFPPLPSRNLIVATQPPPGPSGPSVFPVIPVIDILGGGVNIGPRGPRNPKPPGTKPPGSTTTNPEGTGDGPSKPPTRGDGPVKPPTRGDNPPKPTPTPPPVIYRQVPKTPGSTNSQTVPKPSATPSRKVQKKPTTTNNGPR
ncbi:MAG: hypothetical protein QOH88_1151 [Verrucomicrobiota bacterium]|jgi:hypothetical protein